MHVRAHTHGLAVLRRTRGLLVGSVPGSSLTHALQGTIHVGPVMRCVEAVAFPCSLNHLVASSRGPRAAVSSSFPAISYNCYPTFLVHDNARPHDVKAIALVLSDWVRLGLVSFIIFVKALRASQNSSLKQEDLFPLWQA